MERRNPMSDLGNEKAFLSISHPIVASQNAYHQLPPIPGQANLAHHLLPTIHGSPPVSVSSDLQFNEPSCNNSNVKSCNESSHANFYVRTDRPPPKFNSHARLDRPPFPNGNPMPNAPLPSELKTEYNCPPQFSNLEARSNMPPSQATFHTMFNRPPPFVDPKSIDRPPFQNYLHDTPEKSSISDPFSNLFNTPPFPGNFNVRLVRPPPSQVCFEGETCLAPPNANCHFSEVKRNASSRANCFSSSVGNTYGSNFWPRPQPLLSSDGLIPLSSPLPTPPFLPPTSNNSFPTITGRQPYFPISSPLHSQQTSGSGKTFCLSDGSVSTQQHQHLFSSVGLHQSRDFTKDQSGPAVPSCSAPPPSRHEEAELNFSATTRTSVGYAPVIPFHPLHHQVISFKKDQDLVTKWLEERGKLKTMSESASVSDEFSKNYADSGRDGQLDTIKADGREENITKLADVHSRVAEYTKLLEKLRQCHRIRDGENSTSVKIVLEKISSQLLDPSYQSSVERLVTARRKKRARAKLSRRARLERWQATSRDMDRQRELLCSQHKTKERLKRLVAEADAVLHEVRGKKEETVSLQLLLGALRDLRQHRLNKGDQQGFVATQHHTEHFEKVTEALDDMLESQLQDYELEERTLRAMLDQQRGGDQLSKVLGAIQDDTSDHEAEITSLRDSLFVGAAPADPALLASYTAADASREMLLSRRRTWDKYLVDVGGSGIPIFWVTPNEKPSGGWEKWKVQS